ncbi:hypothetical protein ACJX0J_020670, partial [Zea mays]
VKVVITTQGSSSSVPPPFPTTPPPSPPHTACPTQFSSPKSPRCADLAPAPCATPSPWGTDNVDSAWPHRSRTNLAKGALLLTNKDLESDLLYCI